MKSLFLSCIILLACFPVLEAVETSIPAEEIIKKTDDVRNPGGSYFLKVEIKDTGSSDIYLFAVAVEGNSKTLIETISPIRDKGRNLLMLDENMWAYIPNLKRPVRVALRQKLTGEAANGDISRMRWAEDYKPTIENENEHEWILMLVANKDGLTYDRIRVWVQKNNYYPIKAEYLTGSGKVLKFVIYGGYRNLAGRERPTEITIEDAIRKNEKSVIKILEMKKRAFPGSIFNKNTLGTQNLQT